MAKKRAKSQANTPDTAPTAHDQALLDAVLAQPDDDAPRLVYGEWLQNHGQPARAEFIRLQIERARRPYPESEQSGARGRPAGSARPGMA